MTNIERIYKRIYIEQVAPVRKFKETLKLAADENLKEWPCKYLINGSHHIDCKDCFLKSMRGCYSATAKEVLAWLDSEASK